MLLNSSFCLNVSMYKGIELAYSKCLLYPDLAAFFQNYHSNRDEANIDNSFCVCVFTLDCTLQICEKYKLKSIWNKFCQ